ncbi:MAG TPA: ribosome biogenesis GTPase Der, partial [Stellaceae bacterium]|nr:ribosome biogenesis GTPase Der [Stellaceae bacterium]
MGFTVAILGRPNVGKSTLFNRLVGRRAALVDDAPGVTRDRREGQGRIADLEFRVFDTAGLEEAAPATLSGRMRAQTERSLDLADVVLLVIDAREGVTDDDRHFAGWLRKSGKPVVLIANKAEARAELGAVGEAYALGLGDPVPLSAAHGEGFAELYDRLRDFGPLPEAEMEDAGAPESEEQGERPLQLAIVGRPNVGKSTLVNRLIGEERLLTGPEPGITRDAIALEWDWRGRPIRLVDTAGLRRRAHVQDKLERLSVADTLRAIRFAGTVVLVLDALEPFGRQDLTIANLVAEEGRALVLAANKWDAVVDKPAALRQLRDRITISLAQLQGVTLVPISGLAGTGLDNLMKAVIEADAVWNKRLPTPSLNRWLAAIQQRHPPPLVGA